jgi:hypothetical protein
VPGASSRPAASLAVPAQAGAVLARPEREGADGLAVAVADDDFAAGVRAAAVDGQRRRRPVEIEAGRVSGADPADHRGQPGGGRGRLLAGQRGQLLVGLDRLLEVREGGELRDHVGSAHRIERVLVLQLGHEQLEELAAAPVHAAAGGGGRRQRRGRGGGGGR